MFEPVLVTEEWGGQRVSFFFDDQMFVFRWRAISGKVRGRSLYPTWLDARGQAKRSFPTETYTATNSSRYFGPEIVASDRAWFLAISTSAEFDETLVIAKLSGGSENNPPFPPIQVKLTTQPAIAEVDKSIVIQSQKKLAELGYSPGVADGIVGKNTIRAIKSYQTKSGLPITGILDSTTTKSLGVSR